MSISFSTRSAAPQAVTVNLWVNYLPHRSESSGIEHASQFRHGRHDIVDVAERGDHRHRVRAGVERAARVGSIDASDRYERYGHRAADLAQALEAARIVACRLGGRREQRAEPDVVGAARLGGARLRDVMGRDSEPARVAEQATCGPKW